MAFVAQLLAVVEGVVVAVDAAGEVQLVQIRRPLLQIPARQLHLLHGRAALRDPEPRAGHADTIDGEAASALDRLVRRVREGPAHGQGVVPAETTLGVARGGIGSRGIAGRADQEAEDAAVPGLELLRQHAGVVGGVDRLVPHRRRVTGEIDQPAQHRAVRPAREQHRKLLVGGPFHTREPVTPGRAVRADLTPGVDRSPVEGPAWREDLAHAELRRL